MEKGALKARARKPAAARETRALPICGGNSGTTIEMRCGSLLAIFFKGVAQGDALTDNRTRERAAGGLRFDDD
jgi:hypothetical protein